jgi:hypothetical protein
MYSLGFLPLIIFMRGVADAALLIDIIQLRIFILQEDLASKIWIFWWFVLILRNVCVLASYPEYLFC